MVTYTLHLASVDHVQKLGIGSRTFPHRSQVVTGSCFPRETEGGQVRSKTFLHIYIYMFTNRKRTNHNMAW